MSVDVIDDIPQVFYQMQFKNVKDGADEELWKLVTDTCAGLCEAGIDRKALTAAINRSEFNFKSPQEPAGLIRCIKSMVTWLHGLDPMTYLAVDGIYAQLREKLSGRYYEELLAELMGSENLCLLHARASHTAAAEKDAKEAEKLAAIKASWTEADAAANKELNEKLLAWQQTEDSPQAKAKLPTLPISEVSTEPQWDDTRITAENGVTVLYHPVPSHGIVNFNLYFSLGARPLSELTRLASLSSLLGELPTKYHSSVQLAQEVKTYIGSLSFKVSSFGRKDEPGEAAPMLVVSASVLEENLEKANEIISEILLFTRFDDHEKIKNILLQADLMSRQMVVGAGHAYARIIAGAAYTAEAAVAEAVTGNSYLSWLHKMVSEFDGRVSVYTKLLEDALGEACCRERLLASVTATEYVSLSGLFGHLPKGSSGIASGAYTSTLPAKAGTKIPAQIGFSSQAFHLSQLSEAYDGSLAVASNILSFDYLWNKVRVQGGAYGTGFRADQTGFVMTYSYRDPTPARSVGINKELGDYLRKLSDEKAPLDNFIIASIAATEPLLSPAMRGVLADKLWMTGFSYDSVKLRWCAWIADQMAEKGRLCAVGPEDKLAEFEGLELLDY